MLFGGLATVLVGSVAGVVLVTGGGSSADPLAPHSIRLEPVGAQTPDPFLDENLDLGGADVINLGDPPELEDEVNAGLSGTTASGGTPGLYGGSQDAAICDVQRQIDFFSDPANADKAEAWAEVKDISVDELDDYLGRLTPVRLRFDTRVTNHSFEDGEAQPFQSILQAGTAVLVDEFGVPRSKCFCGNPLTPPLTTDGDVDRTEALDVEVLAENPEDAWEGFDPAEVVTVTPSPEPLEAIVVATEGGEQVEIPVTSSGGGEASGAVDGYTIDEVAAAFPTDDQLLQDFNNVRGRCVDGDSSGCQENAIWIWVETDQYVPGSMFLTAEVDPDSDVVLEEPNPDASSVVPFEYGEWSGHTELFERYGDCEAATLHMASRNTLVEFEAHENGCAAAQEMAERYARPIIDSLG